jgi:hypothetical protein
MANAMQVLKIKVEYMFSRDVRCERKWGKGKRVINEIHFSLLKREISCLP